VITRRAASVRVSVHRWEESMRAIPVPVPLRDVLFTALGGVLALLGALVIAPPAPVGANTLQVTNCTDTDVSGDGSLRGEIAAAGVGDTIVFDQNCTITLSLANGPLALAQNVTIDGTGHTVTVDGGSGGSGQGVFQVNTGVTANLSTLTIQNGYSHNGGGIYNNGGTLTVTNSTLTGNSGDDAGGIYNSGTATVTNSTISGNSTRDVFSTGGIKNDGTLTLTNTIVAGNTGTYIADLGGTITSGGHNLIGIAGGGIISGVNGDIVNPTPLLAALGRYGGPTQTIALLAGSPAIDAGNDAVCAQTGAGKVNNADQRGITRPQGAHCDIGAFEALPPPTPLPSPKPPGPSGGPPTPCRGDDRQERRVGHRTRCPRPGPEAHPSAGRGAMRRTSSGAVVTADPGGTACRTLVRHERQQRGSAVWCLKTQRPRKSANVLRHCGTFSNPFLFLTFVADRY
jgi:hypothetical protein